MCLFLLCLNSLQLICILAITNKKRLKIIDNHITLELLVCEQCLLYLAHGQVIQTIRAVEDHTLDS